MTNTTSYIPQLWNINSDMPWGNNYPQEVKVLLKEYPSETACKEACSSIEAIMRKEGWSDFQAFPYPW